MEENFDNEQQEIEYLRSHIDRLEANRAKLLDQLIIKEKRDAIFNVDLDESDLINFHHLEKCDQKLLAILYWDKLTDQQKQVFTDWERRELSTNHEKKLQEMMSDPVKMKQHFLRGAAPILDTMIRMANGDEKIKGDGFAFREVWEVLKAIINAASEPAPMIDLRGKDISSQIDEILSAVTKGDITFIEAKEYMSLVSSGFNLQELPKLMQKLEMLENS